MVREHILFMQMDTHHTQVHIYTTQNQDKNKEGIICYNECIISDMN